MILPTDQIAFTPPTRHLPNILPFERSIAGSCIVQDVVHTPRVACEIDRASSLCRAFTRHEARGRKGCPLRQDEEGSVEVLTQGVLFVGWYKNIDRTIVPSRVTCDIPPRRQQHSLFGGSSFLSPIQKDDTAADRKDIGLFQKTLMSLARRLGYRVLMSLANYKYAGTAVLIRCGGPMTRVTSEGFMCVYVCLRGYSPSLSLSCCLFA